MSACQCPDLRQRGLIQQTPELWRSIDLLVIVKVSVPKCVFFKTLLIIMPAIDLRLFTPQSPAGLRHESANFPR